MLFGICHSLFSDLAFLTFAAVLLGPISHRFLHSISTYITRRELSAKLNSGLSGSSM